MIIAIIGPMNDHTVPEVVGNQQLKKTRNNIIGQRRSYKDDYRFDRRASSSDLVQTTKIQGTCIQGNEWPLFVCCCVVF